MLMQSQCRQIFDALKAAPAATFLIQPQRRRKRLGTDETGTSKLAYVRFSDPPAEADIHGGDSLADRWGSQPTGRFYW